MMKIRTMVMAWDPRLREAITSTARTLGHDILNYSDPAACLAYGGCDCHTPSGIACADIIIIDNSMPRMSGIQFVKAQTQRGCRASLANKAIMAVAWQTEELDLAAALGCRVFTKPLPMQELADWLRECEARILAAGAAVIAR